jgi:type II secretory pathway component PulF
MLCQNNGLKPALGLFSFGRYTGTRMSKFYYRARNPKGSIVEGAIQAENAWFAKKSLNKDKLVVLSINRFNLKVFWHDFRAFTRRFSEQVKLEEKLVLMSQLETGISIGIPIVQMFQLLQKDLENRFLKNALADIAEKITEGSTMHDAFAKHPYVFNRTVVGLVRTGEVSGKLEAALGRISQMIEQEAKNQSKIKSAIFYPKIVLFVLAVVFVIAVYFLIPKLKEFLAGYGADLPPITLFVIGISDAFVSYWHFLAIIGIALYFGFKKFVSKPSRKLKYDYFKLRTPIFGKVFLLIELNNICVVLNLLLQSGVPLVEALEILKGSQRNDVFKLALDQAIEKISRGGSLSSGMDDPKLFPATFRNMLSVGEESGRLEPILNRMGAYYQTQIDYKLDNLSKLIEPILLFIIFGMVLVLALALLLPIWKMNKAVVGHQ